MYKDIWNSFLQFYLRFLLRISSSFRERWNQSRLNFYWIDLFLTPMSHSEPIWAWTLLKCWILNCNKRVRHYTTIKMYIKVICGLSTNYEMRRWLFFTPFKFDPLRYMRYFLSNKKTTLISQDTIKTNSKTFQNFTLIVQLLNET